jgi:hypothetical protein
MAQVIYKVGEAANQVRKMGQRAVQWIGVSGRICESDMVGWEIVHNGAESELEWASVLRGGG